MPLITNLNRPDSWYEHLASNRNYNHDLHCLCNQCHCTPVTCVLCRNEFRHIAGLHRHLTQFHHGKESITRRQIKAKIKQRELIPDGLGYLEKLFIHEDKKYVNTTSISRFADHLKDIIGYRKISRAKQMQFRAQLEILKAHPDEHTSITLQVPNKYLLPAYQIWEISGAHPYSVYLAFGAYGIAYAAHELRKYPSLPDVPTNPGQKLRKTDNDTSEDQARPTKERSF